MMTLSSGGDLGGGMVHDSGVEMALGSEFRIGIARSYLPGVGRPVEVTWKAS